MVSVLPLQKDYKIIKWGQFPTKGISPFALITGGCNYYTINTSKLYYNISNLQKTKLLQLFLTTIRYMGYFQNCTKFIRHGSIIDFFTNRDVILNLS